MSMTNDRIREILCTAGNNGKEFSMDGLQGAEELKFDYRLSCKRHGALARHLFVLSWIIAMLYCILKPLFDLGVVSLPELVTNNELSFFLRRLLLVISMFLLVDVAVTFTIS
jgi:hypothetical protein